MKKINENSIVSIVDRLDVCVAWTLNQGVMPTELPDPQIPGPRAPVVPSEKVFGVGLEGPNTFRGGICSPRVSLFAESLAVASSSSFAIA